MKYAIIILSLGLGIFVNLDAAHAEEAPALSPAEVIDAALIEAPEAGRLHRKATADEAAQDAWLVGGPAECEDACAPPVLDPCDPWSGTLALAFSTSQGNSDRLDFLLRGEAVYEKGPWYFEGRLAFVYGESEGTRSAQNYHGEMNARRTLNPKTYVFVKYNYDQDDLAGLQYRHRLVGGIGRKFIDRKNTQFNGEVGAGYVFEKRQYEKETQDPSAYLGLDYGHTWADESEFHVHLDYFPNLAEFDLSLLTCEAKYTKPLFGKFKLLLGLRVDWVMNPPAPTDPVDLLVIVGMELAL
jgi:hypothetical protein